MPSRLVVAARDIRRERIGRGAVGDVRDQALRGIHRLEPGRVGADREHGVAARGQQRADDAGPSHRSRR